MARRKAPSKREIIQDPKYRSQLVMKFINHMMKNGKKSVSERILYESFDIIEKRTKSDPLKMFKKAIDNVKPVLEVKSRRVGGATYQVPVEVRQDRRLTLSMRWLISYSRGRTDKTMAQKLASEFIDAANNKGLAIKKREDTHKMAEANKAFAHYRW